MPLFFYLPCLRLSSLADMPFKYSAIYLLNTKSFSTLTNKFIIDTDSHLSVIPLKWLGKLFCSILCLLEGPAAQCQGVIPFINVIWFNKMKTEDQFSNISIWHNYHPSTAAEQTPQLSGKPSWRLLWVHFNFSASLALAVPKDAQNVCSRNNLQVEFPHKHTDAI